MSRVPLFGVARMDSIDLGGTRALDVPVLHLHEVIAGRLVALIDRQAARDLFDARRILEIPDLDWTQIKAAMLVHGASGRRDWRQASLNDIGGDPRELRQKLAICPPRDRFAGEGGVEAWIAESVALCRGRLAPLSISRPGNRRSWTAFSTVGRSTPPACRSRPRFRPGLPPCRCWPGRRKTSERTAPRRPEHRAPVSRLAAGRQSGLGHLHRAAKTAPCGRAIPLS